MIRAGEKRVVLNGDEVKEAVADLIVKIRNEEDTAGPDFAIVGIRTRGVVLGQRIKNALEENREKPIDFGVLDITLYRDDLHTSRAAPVVKSTDIDFAIEGKRIILIDDVIYTGRTIRAALAALVDFGRPKYIRFATLFERPGRELPIQADYVSRKIDAAPDEDVRVHMEEVDGADEVVIAAE